jgi:cell division septation protein DedD
MTPTMTDIHDIKPALDMGLDLRWVYWAIGALVLLALAALVWRRWRKREKPEAVEMAPPPLPPDAEAMQMLDALAAEGNPDPKPFYFRLSAVIRRYLERRFDFPAAEMTTEELLPRVDRLPMAPELAQALKSFCRAADPVKFAGAPADTGRMARDLAFARDLVRRTSAPAEPDPGNVDAPAPARPRQEDILKLPTPTREDP